MPYIVRSIEQINRKRQYTKLLRKIESIGYNLK